MVSKMNFSHCDYPCSLLECLAAININSAVLVTGLVMAVFSNGQNYVF